MLNFNSQDVVRESVFDFVEKYGKVSAMVLVVTLCVGSGYYYHRVCKYNKIAAATSLLQEVYALAKVADQNTMDALDKKILEVSQAAPSSLPSVLAHFAKADVLTRLGKHLDASEILSTGLRHISSDVVKQLFEIKQARVLLHSADVQAQDSGLAMLDEISLVGGDVSKGLAAFFLYRYFWDAKKFEEAKKYAEIFLASTRESQSYNPLVTEVSFNLSTIS